MAESNIFYLDIAVDDAPIVQILNREAHIPKDAFDILVVK
jgi:hypothetical protein